MNFLNLWNFWNEIRKIKKNNYKNVWECGRGCVRCALCAVGVRCGRGSWVWLGGPFVFACVCSSRNLRPFLNNSFFLLLLFFYHVFCGWTDPIHQKSVINNHVHHRQLSLHKQPRKQRAGALMLPSSCLDGSITRVGPG